MRVLCPETSGCNVVRTGWKQKEGIDCAQSDVRAFDIVKDWKAMTLEAGGWDEVFMKGGRRVMAAWRKEEKDVARYHLEKTR